ncbi:ATP-binding protein [Halovivax gelatinilyticus]|uniref:ATP-binding protein n=1 Tax=Halovivax gelatinilyticus TaxID=2961597 RepID=UPI0020CA8BCB|nr:BREX system ATP-binding domain-containing protein [Halovivax gelatinilyticus]
MEVPGVDDLVLVALDRAGTEEWTPALRATTIANRIDLAETMAARVSLLSTLASMAADGLVETQTAEGDDQEAYALTATGRDRARTVAERYESATVTAGVNDDRVEGPLTEVADRFGLDLVTAMARLSPSGEVTVEATLDSAFVGREAEREAIERAFDAVGGGEAALLVVEGEAGIGKTTLFRECVSLAADRGFETLVGQADPERSDPYHALTDAVPWAIEHLEGAPTPPSASVATNQSLGAAVAMRYGAVLDELAERTTDRPIVLGIEDLQWADAASLALLTSILEGLESVPIAVVITMRDDDSADETLIDAARCELTVCHLGPFDRAEVGELIERRVGRRGVPEACLDAIYEHTGGVGLFVEETVDDLLDRGIIDPHRGTYPESLADVPLPSVVESTIRDRLDRLDEPTHHVLEAAAVAGTTISLSTLRAVSEGSSDRLRDHAQLLVDGRVWERLDDETYRFASHILRSTVLETLDPARRAVLERRVADHLAERSDPPHAELARRYDRAGEADRALEHAVEAGEAAYDVYAHEEAIDAYQLALALARDLERDAEVIEALESLANVYQLTGEFESAHTHLQYVRSHTDDPDRIRRTYASQSSMCLQVGELERAIELVERGLALEGPRSSAYVGLLDTLASVQFQAGDFREAIATARYQYALAKALDDARMMGTASFQIGRSHRQLGRAERAVESLEAARDLLEPLDDPVALASTLNDLGISYITAGRFEEGVAAMERCGDLAEEAGDVATAINSFNNLGVHAIGRGDWVDAREHFDRVYELAARVGNDRMRVIALSNEGVIDIMSDDVQVAREKFETALELSRSIGHDHQTTFARINLAQVEALSGGLDEAERYATEALERARADGYVRAEADAMRMRGIVSRERGDVERAVERHHEALERARESENSMEISKAARDLAESLVAVGEAEAALERCDEAEANVPDGFRIDQVGLEATRARALAAVGDERASDALRSILEETRELDHAQVELQVRRDLAWLALDSGDRSAALEQLDRGYALAERTHTHSQREWFEDAIRALEEGGCSADDLLPLSGPFGATLD